MFEASKFDTDESEIYISKSEVKLKSFCHSMDVFVSNYSLQQHKKSVCKL